jgi:hypothetical protein
MGHIAYEGRRGKERAGELRRSGERQETDH